VKDAVWARSHHAVIPTPPLANAMKRRLSPTKLQIHGVSLLPLPLVVFLQHRPWPFTIQPALRLGIAFEKGIPEGGAEGEDGAVVIRVLLTTFAGQGAFAKGSVLGFVEDEFVFVAGRQRGIDCET